MSPAQVRLMYAAAGIPLPKEDQRKLRRKRFKK
jgi:hypothetical protein